MPAFQGFLGWTPERVLSRFHKDEGLTLDQLSSVDGAGTSNPRKRRVRVASHRRIAEAGQCSTAVVFWRLKIHALPAVTEPPASLTAV